MVHSVLATGMRTPECKRRACLAQKLKEPMFRGRVARFVAQNELRGVVFGRNQQAKGMKERSRRVAAVQNVSSKNEIQRPMSIQLRKHGSIPIELLRRTRRRAVRPCQRRSGPGACATASAACDGDAPPDARNRLLA